MKNVLLFIGVVIVLVACSGDNGEWRVKSENPEFLHRSVKQVTDVIVHDIFSPPVASRIYGYMSIAAYEAALHQDAKYISLAGQLKGLESLPQPEPGATYSFSLASVQAALKVGRTLVFSEDKMDVFYNSIMQEYRDTGIPDDVFDRSIEFGNEVPPAYMDAVEPHWNKIRTFVLDSAQQFKPAPPTPFSTDKNSQFYKEAIEIYEMGNTLTSEQREIAFFWDCNPFMMNVKGHVMFATKKISPGGHWINITNVACKKNKADFTQSAEAYTRVSIALMDAFISCWDEKYRSKLIRLETYINQYIDEDWVPVLHTPPFPEYTSGHSVISAASAVTLTDLFGDNFAFTDSTEVEFGLTARSFKSFIEASEEAAISRMYGGIHYRPAVYDGVNEGRALGSYILQNIKTRKENTALK
ncbi:MAG: vanadium-dependent haloperoxidase [Flammeovirgaceae bacterium]|nr:vanadium-dependent haloperoxidase [Flammeovirgaceae bacterium]